MAVILVTDDSALARRMLRGILESAGHQVLEATDGLHAIETYLLERPDLVLLDMIMTGMSGFEVLDRLRELDPEVRVVVATADIQTSTQQMAEEAGGVGFIGKPFTASEVLDVVERALGGEDHGTEA
jgi:two-component system chemotaxis response regulator CheY